MSRRRKPCPKAPKRPKVLPGDLYNCTLPFLGAKVSIDHRNPSRSIAGTMQGCRKKASGRGSEVVVGKTYSVGTVKRALGLAKPRARRPATERGPSTEMVLARPATSGFTPRAMDMPPYLHRPAARAPLMPVVDMTLGNTAVIDGHKLSKLLTLLGWRIVGVDGQIGNIAARLEIDGDVPAHGGKRSLVFYVDKLGRSTLERFRVTRGTEKVGRRGNSFNAVVLDKEFAGRETAPNVHDGVSMLLAYLFANAPRRPSRPTNADIDAITHSMLGTTPAPRPMLALPAPVYAPPPVAAHVPLPRSAAPVKGKNLRLSQSDRAWLARAVTGEVRTDNLSSGDTKTIRSLISRDLMERRTPFAVGLTNAGHAMAETMDEVRRSPGTKSFTLITAEPTWMTALTPAAEVEAPPPPRPVAPPPAAPQGGARLLPVTAAPPAFDVRPSLAGGKVQHYIMWERVTMPDGTLSWVERPWIANDAETLREDIPEKLAQRLAATRASGYSVVAYDRLLGLLQAAFDARGLPARPEGRALFAKELANAIVTGKYTTALDPQNKTTRDVFAKFTGIELPKQQGKTMAMFTGQPFHVVEGIFSEGPSAATAAPTFDEKEWRRFYYGLAGKLLAAAQADLAAARKRGDEGARYEADRQVQAAGQLRKLATNEDVSFARLNATWHSTWADVGIPRAPADAMSQPLSPLPAGMKANRPRRLAFTHQRW